MKKLKWVWIGILIVVIGGSVYLFSSSGMTDHTMDFAQAYLDKPLYENAIEKAKTNKKVKEIFGELESIDKLAILEGDVAYSNGNKTVKMSVRISGSKEKGTMHILANKENENWKYKKIDIISKKQKIEVNIIEREH